MITRMLFIENITAIIKSGGISNKANLGGVPLVTI